MTLKKQLVAFIALAVFCSKIMKAQQEPDLEFEPVISSPRYISGSGPTIGIDAAHNNLHTLEGGFAAFGKLLTKDGYLLKSIDEIKREVLEKLDIFVIANPLHESNVGNWQRPIHNAFTDEEMSHIVHWMKSGGKLLLVADHMPFAGAAMALAEKFDVKYYDGFVISEEEMWPPETFRKSDGNLYEDMLTSNIDSLASFTGSAILAPTNSTKLGRFPDSHRLLIPERAWVFDELTEVLPLEELSFGAYMIFGEGKVACFSEAAMFTAQLVQERYKVGFNSPRAPDNQQFILNLVHWLDNGKI